MANSDVFPASSVPTTPTFFLSSERDATTDTTDVPDDYDCLIFGIDDVPPPPHRSSYSSPNSPRASLAGLSPTHRKSQSTPTTPCASAPRVSVLISSIDEEDDKRRSTDNNSIRHPLEDLMNLSRSLPEPPCSRNDDDDEGSGWDSEGSVASTGSDTEHTPPPQRPQTLQRVPYKRARILHANLQRSRTSPVHDRRYNHNLQQFKSTTSRSPTTRSPQTSPNIEINPLFSALTKGQPLAFAGLENKLKSSPIHSPHGSPSHVPLRSDLLDSFKKPNLNCSKLRGYMHKKNPGTVPIWKRRYFYMSKSGNMLLYVKKDSDRNPIGEIFIHLVEAIESRPDKKPYGCRFDIVTNPRVYVLRTDTPEQCRFWVNQLNRIKLHQEYNRPVRM